MMDAFNETNAKIRVHALATDSEVDEQRGYKAIFAHTGPPWAKTCERVRNSARY